MSILRSPRSLEGYFKTNPVSSVMIVLISTVFVMQLFFSTFTSTRLEHLGAIHFYSVYFNNEWYRLVTAIFLHGDFIHYLFNTLFGIYILGAALERLIGSRKYLITLIVSGLGASLVVFLYDFYLFSVAQREGIFPPLPLTLGASGAIFGAMGYLFYLTIVKPEWFTLQDISSIRAIMFLNIIFSFFGNISTSGHLGGLAFGLLTAFLLTRFSPYKGKRKGFEDPFNPYAQESWRIEDLDEIEILDDDDDDDRRVW